MKVNNVSIFMGEDPQSGRRQLLGLNQEQGNTGCFFAGSLNNNIDPIAQKKQQAQKQALKVVSDAFAADRKLDTEMAEREAKIKELRAENLEAKRALQDLEAQKQGLGKAYGLGEEGLSDEDWNILDKGCETPSDLTDEEKVRFQEMKEQGLTEYYGRCKDIDDLAEPYKQNPMIAAQEEAEAIMDAAREEIIGMIKDEGMDHVDEELQEKVEQAQENKEKKQEEEEKLEAIREEKAQVQSRAEAAREKAKENEERAEELLDALPAEEMLQMKDGRADFQQELKDIMNRMKLMAEDLKGAAVDATL